MLGVAFSDPLIPPAGKHYDKVLLPDQGVTKRSCKWTLLFHGYKPDDQPRRPHRRFHWMAPAERHIRPGLPRDEWVRPMLRDAEVQVAPLTEEACLEA
jgi:hypothetical protein